jgi:uncharacterized protein YceH (UPF0502 family)
VILTPVEARVVGCLIEKQFATPVSYPLTVNALVHACNQTSNRDPIVSYDEATVQEALRTLREKRLTRVVYSPQNRAPKHRHALDEELALDRRELAVLSVLLLRGPQTSGEIRARADRLGSFSDLSEVESTLEGLAERGGGPLVVNLGRRPGQKEARYTHLLEGEARVPALSSATTEEERLAALEQELGALRSEVAELRTQVTELRRRLG